MPEEKGTSIADLIRKRLQEGSSGEDTNRPQEILDLPSGGTKKTRFLSDMEDATTVKFHSRWNPRLNRWQLRPQPCKQYYNEKCKYCGNDDYRTYEQFVWTIYSYDDDAKRLFIQNTGKGSCLAQLLDINQTHGTLKSRDINISKHGKRKDQQFTVLALDATEYKGKLRNPFAKDVVFDILKGLITPEKEIQDSGTTDAGKTDATPAEAKPSAEAAAAAGPVDRSRTD